MKPRSVLKRPNLDINQTVNVRLGMLDDHECIWWNVADGVFHLATLGKYAALPFKPANTVSSW
jgi:hypothetical protein